jgi:hypothetical protein
MRRTADLGALALVYLDAKRAVIDAGFAWEVDWQAMVNFDQLTESAFLRESAWVVLCAGMRESVVRGRFNALSDAFLEWRSAVELLQARRTCRRRALAVFNNRRKIDAIISIAARVAATSFDNLRAILAQEGVHYLQSLPFIGPITSFHLAKNIGLQVAKPDRHLARMARMFGFPSVQMMCGAISDWVYDPIPVVDIVLWRFATLHRKYRCSLLTAYASHRRDISCVS